MIYIRQIKTQFHCLIVVVWRDDLGEHYEVRERVWDYERPILLFGGIADGLVRIFRSVFYEMTLEAVDLPVHSKVLLSLVESTVERRAISTSHFKETSHCTTKTTFVT